MAIPHDTNQCDGCRAGHPLIGIVHHPTGSTPWDGQRMICTRDRYLRHVERCSCPEAIALRAKLDDQGAILDEALRDALAAHDESIALRKALEEIIVTLESSGGGMYQRQGKACDIARRALALGEDGT